MLGEGRHRHDPTRRYRFACWEDGKVARWIKHKLVSRVSLPYIENVPLLLGMGVTR